MNYRRTFHPKAGFTLIELLTVIGILALLAAIVFPVLAQVRGRGRETVCVSNLRQIGLAIHAYAQDYDDQFPFGGDPLDFRPGAWADSKYQPLVQTMRPLPEVLNPYTKSKRIWACPADVGFEKGGRNEETVFDTRPSSFDRFGTSYYYYTSLVVHQNSVSSMQAWNRDAPHEERGPSNIIVLYDGTGLWHGGYVLNTRRYPSLYADGHARVLPRDKFEAAFRLAWTKLP